MNEVIRPVNNHKAYHAHVYFDEDAAEFARQLCMDAGKAFGLDVGRFHEKLVGPHPMSSCQIIFGGKDFDALVPWLDNNREDLTIFVHALTGDEVADHTTYAYCLGQDVELNLEFFGV